MVAGMSGLFSPLTTFAPARAQRRAVALSRQQEIPPEVLQYLNRLSDLLFVVARRAAGDEEELTPA